MTEIQTVTSETPSVPGFKIEAEVTAKDIAGLLCSGFEGGVGYWCRIMDYQQADSAVPVIDSDRVYGPTDLPVQEGCAVICRIDDGETKDTDRKYKKLVLDRAAVQRGLTLMAQKWPKHWADFTSGNYDACTGDVFIQLCLLGDVVYG